MRWFTLSILFISIGQIAIAAESLDELIRAVESNEKHYEKLQVTLTNTYEFHRKVAPANAKAEDQEFQDSETRFSLVLEGSSFRLHSTIVAHVPPEYLTSDSTLVFDGTTYRSFEQNVSKDSVTGKLTLGKSHGLISDRPPSLTNLARPHMLLLNSGYPEVPLSTYLRGHEAVRARPNPGYFPDRDVLEIHDGGSEVFHNLQCRVIRIDSVSHGCKLWLAEDRNYIPVRKLAYTYRWSPEIPIAESIIDEWKELRPGVWFPAKAHTQTFDVFIVQNEGRQQPSWRETYKVTSVSFEPQITPDTFTKLEFPPGTKVRVVKKAADAAK